MGVTADQQTAFQTRHALVDQTQQETGVVGAGLTKGCVYILAGTAEAAQQRADGAGEFIAGQAAVQYRPRMERG